MQQQHFQATARQHDDAFGGWLERTMPEFSKGEGFRQLRTAARDILRETGMSDAAIAAAWNSPELRHLQRQTVLALAARDRINQQRERRARWRSA
jgi:hypothetical protein